MCRFFVYKASEPILLSHLVTNPSHSILNQSYDSRLRLDTRRPHNGDGFGIGYYTDIKLGPNPCIFTSTIPAWNCINLERIASKTASSLIFAHVRATTEGSLSDDNCHPFSYGTLMWMHNGGLGAWKYIKRRLGEQLSDKWYGEVHGSTDTEWAFALFLNTLEKMGLNPDKPPADGFGPTVLRVALTRTIGQINHLIKGIPKETIEKENVDCRSLLNFAVSDGHTVICSRYVSSKKDEAASLYYSSGSSWDDKAGGNYHMDRKDKGADVVLVASEPLSFERDNWVTVPTNSTITIHKQTVMIHPILDEYYNSSPDFKRSSKLAISKGLGTNEKPLTPKAASPAPSSNFPSPNSDNEIHFSSAMKNPIRSVSSGQHIARDEDPFLDHNDSQGVETSSVQQPMVGIPMVGVPRFEIFFSPERSPSTEVFSSLSSPSNDHNEELTFSGQSSVNRSAGVWSHAQGAPATPITPHGPVPNTYQLPLQVPRTPGFTMRRFLGSDFTSGS